VADGPAKHRRELYEGAGGEWRLSTPEKRRILLNNIYGVDIDPQAVEVTKLSLLLKVLEGESEQTLESQLRIFHERALPDLGSNIKCGNSLVGSDFYDGRQLGLLDEEEQYRVNVFDWEREFPDIIRAGGFDAVIGNPPYVFGRDWKALNISDDIKAYLGDRYKSSPYQLDMFSIFMEKAHELCRRSGWIGQIVPNVWLTNTYSSTTRAFILGQSKNLSVTVPPANVFAGLTVDTIIYTLQKADRPGGEVIIKALRDGGLVELARLPAAQYVDGQRPISTALDSASADLVHKLKAKFSELQDFGEITRGIHSYRMGGFGQTAFGTGPQTTRDVEERPYHHGTPKEGSRPFIYGRDLRRFTPPAATEFVKYGPWLAEPRRPEFFEGERVYSRKILGDRLVVTIETTDSVADQQVYITRPRSNSVKAHYLAGLLGSRLMAFFVRAFYDEVNDAFPQIKVGQLKSLPIPPVENPADRARHDRLVVLVEQLLALNKQLAAARTPDERTRLERLTAATDRQIDRLVYELYGLTDAEVEIVEKAVPS
jgi:hypothetical protein